MAEYYPLLAKAVGSLPNSTPDMRRVVYERARKALIGQLRTLHPPVPEEDIQRESVELDRAVERLEAELAGSGLPAPAPEAKPAAPPPPKPTAPPVKPPKPAATSPEQDRSGSAAAGRPAPLLRTKPPAPKTDQPRAETVAQPPADQTYGDAQVARATAAETLGTSRERVAASDPVNLDAAKRPSVDAGTIRPPRADGQRPIAPTAPVAKGAGGRLWIVFAALAVLVVGVAVAAFLLRDKRVAISRNKPAEQQTQSENGKLAERVGGASSSQGNNAAPQSAARPGIDAAQGGASTAATTGENEAQTQAGQSSSGNPEVPVAQRAALLVEAPDEQNKVKTFIGHAVWKLNNVNGGGPNEPVGLAVEADVDVPEDRLKAIITFEKNTDPSLPASHTIKIRFVVQPGSATGDVQKISVPQLRPEAVATGEALTGVTVPVVTNSFLVGLAPGSAEGPNLKLLEDMQWIDIPMLLSNGKIAKLTFEKGSSGQRDINEAVAAWQKQ